jgi:hypothetical protein
MKTTVLANLALVSLTQAIALEKRQTPVENNATGTPNLIVNGDFSNGTNGWKVQPDGAIDAGYLCVNVPAGGAANASFLQTVNNFTEIKNDIYFLVSIPNQTCLIKTLSDHSRTSQHTLRALSIFG